MENKLWDIYGTKMWRRHRFFLCQAKQSALSRICARILGQKEQVGKPQNRNGRKNEDEKKENKTQEQVVKLQNRNLKKNKDKKKESKTQSLNPRKRKKQKNFNPIIIAYGNGKF